jgi:DNA-directed RNA polymerase subunit RPC12/RpoP
MEDHSKAGKGDSENQSAGWTVCPCNNCSGNLEFDAARVGETAKCPHCGMDTVLFIPQVPVDSPPSKPELAPKPKPNKAKIIKLPHKQHVTTPYRGGIEESLENTGRTFGYLGGCAGGCGLIAACVLLVIGQTTWAVVCCIAAIVAFVQGAVLERLFKAGAEIIRLLKKFNGLKFSGQISQPTGLLDDALFYVCSACGASVASAETKCARCGAEFEPGLTKAVNL